MQTITDSWKNSEEIAIVSQKNDDMDQAVKNNWHKIKKKTNHNWHSDGLQEPIRFFKIHIANEFMDLAK